MYYRTYVHRYGVKMSGGGGGRGSSCCELLLLDVSETRVFFMGHFRNK